MIIGIDPGLGGAVACLDYQRGHHIISVPLVQKTYGKGNQIHAAALADYIRSYSSNGAVVAIERVASSPQMGVASAYRFGHTAGVIDGIVQALKLPVTYVRPQVWKKHFGLLKKSKDASRTLALERFPELAEYMQRKKDADRAEALLIAVWRHEVMTDK